MSRFKLILGVALSLALVVGLAVSLLSGTGTPSSETATSSPRSELFGIVQGARLDDQDLQAMAETGVGVNRFLLRWDSVQPSPGSFEWSTTDSFIGALAAHGIRPLPFVWGSPPWVAKTPPHPPLDATADEQAWRDFLEAAVARYGPGGSYWANGYRQQFGAGATPLPIQAWQVWNEPNLTKYFETSPAAPQYARLLRISHDAIKSEDPQARIVLAGMPGSGDSTAWAFLKDLYQIPGTRDDFDVAALHPYARDLDEFRREIVKFRAAMTSEAERRTPLWLTEVAWGSAPPDRFGLNKGLTGQEQMLSGSFKLILKHRSAWNVQRVLWFDWRDPSRNFETECSFCGSAGLLRFDRSPKPAYDAFKGFAAAN